MKQELIDSIPEDDPRVKEHRKKYPNDPLPIPFSDPEPQVTLPYSTKYPYHVQIHRDAFSYGDVGPKADSRVIVDLRFFGKQDIQHINRVSFPAPPPGRVPVSWKPGVTDIYGMPQATVGPQLMIAIMSTEARGSLTTAGPRMTMLVINSTPSLR